MRTDIKELEKILQYEFRKPELLEQAVTHSSYANDNMGSPSKGSNERLEFLGDAILDAVVSVYLYEHMENREGEMSTTRADSVDEKALAAVNRSFGLWEFLRLGRGEEITGGRNRDSIIADEVEAIIGAVYMDGGIEAATGVVNLLMADTLKDALAGRLFSDYKSALQMHFQKHGETDINYEIISAVGPDHDKTFTAQVSVNGTVLGQGTGKRKQQAEQEAAKAALASLNER